MRGRTISTTAVKHYHAGGFTNIYRNGLFIMSGQIGSSHRFPRIIVSGQLPKPFSLYVRNACFPSSHLLMACLARLYKLTTCFVLEEKSSLPAKAERHVLCLGIV
jgi:hypothetical protein